MKTCNIANILSPSGIVICMTIILSCSSRNAPELIENTDIAIRDSSLEVSKKWKQDNWGCSGYRNAEKLQLLIDSYDISIFNREEVQNVFGIPEAEVVDQRIVTSEGVFLNVPRLRYIFDGQCQGSVLVDSLDYCWVDILLAGDTTLVQQACF